jgi:hypothetical protein
MTNDEGREPEGAPERSPKAGAGAPSGVDGNGPSCPCLLFESGAELLDHRSPVCIYDALETDCSKRSCRCRKLDPVGMAHRIGSRWPGCWVSSN